MYDAPVAFIVGVSIVFACCAYLAIAVVAGAVYAKDAPLADGPKPGNVTIVQTLAIVAVSAAIGALCAARGTDLATLGVAVVVVFALCAAIWTDVTRGFIGDWFTLPPIVLVVAVAFMKHDFFPVLISFAIVTTPFALAAFFSKGRGMGWGDVKLVALGASLLDVQTSMLMFALACMVACAIAFARRKRGEPIAFAPYLAGAIGIGSRYRTRSTSPDDPSGTL